MHWRVTLPFVLPVMPHVPELVLFKYDQINSPMENPIVQECRGIILDEADDWRVIARPFTKFYNYGEPNAAPIDWTTARVQEKVDGSLCAFYHYKGDWHVATTGTPDAGGRVHNGERLFRDLIWETAQKHELRMLSPAHTYLFELTSPYNRVVVPHTNRVLRCSASGTRKRARGWPGRRGPVPDGNRADCARVRFRFVRGYPGVLRPS